uniref:Phytosulfokine-beta n=1 Tax=Quercus lobata TaxID=97700 RepID=A0A7N2L5K4_QUELO
MKTVLFVVVACGLLLLCIEGDAKRILFNLVADGATDVKPNNQPEKSSTMGNPISGSVPTVDANNENTANNSSDKDNKSEDDKNDSYGSYVLAEMEAYRKGMLEYCERSSDNTTLEYVEYPMN